jgi:hypothetical protein
MRALAYGNITTGADKLLQIIIVIIDRLTLVLAATFRRAWSSHSEDLRTPLPLSMRKVDLCS